MSPTTRFDPADLTAIDIPVHVSIDSTGRTASPRALTEALATYFKSTEKPRDVDATAAYYRERKMGAEHPSTLSSVNNLALLLKKQGGLAAAKSLYERALKGREAALGPDHPDTLVSVKHLAGLLMDQGDLAGAKPLYERALKGREAALGPDHPDTLGSVNNWPGSCPPRAISPGPSRCSNAP